MCVFVGTMCLCVTCVCVCWFSFININVKHVDLNFEPVCWHIFYFESDWEIKQEVSLFLMQINSKQMMNRWLDGIPSYKQGFHLNFKSANENGKKSVCMFCKNPENEVTWWACRWYSGTPVSLAWSWTWITVFLWVLCFFSQPPNMQEGGLVFLNCL